MTDSQIPPGVSPELAAKQALDREMSALEAKMSDPRSNYWRGPTAPVNQARYRELIEAKTKIEG